MNTISEKKVCWVDKYVGAIVCIYLENWENETQTRYTNHIDFKHGKKLSFLCWLEYYFTWLRYG